MSIYSYKQRNSIVLAILVILGCAILFSLRIIAGALLSTIVLYTIFRPVFLFLTQYWHWKHWIAAIAIILISLIIIVMPFLTLSLLVIDKIAEFQQDPMRIKVFIQKIDDFAGSKLNLPDFLNKALQKAGDFAQELFPSILGSAAGVALGLVVMYFLLYFMFIQREEFEAGLLKYAPFSEQNAIKFATELKTTTYSTVLGQGFIAIVQGALVSIGFFMWNTRSHFLGSDCYLPFIFAPGWNPDSICTRRTYRTGKWE